MQEVELNGFMAEKQGADQHLAIKKLPPTDPTPQNATSMLEQLHSRKLALPDLQHIRTPCLQLLSAVIDSAAINAYGPLLDHPV